MEGKGNTVISEVYNNKKIHIFNLKVKMKSFQQYGTLRPWSLRLHTSRNFQPRKVRVTQ
jgi:hypothetical protein